MAATTVLRSPVRMCTLGRSSSESYMRPVTSAVFANSRKLASTNVSRENSTSSVQLLSRQDSLSEEDQHILALISSIPQRPVPTSDPVMERFRIYDTAAQVYKTARGDGRLGVSVRDRLNADRQLKRRVYQLVFEVLHHREVLLELLVESGFYVRNFKLHSHEELVIIMLYEFQNEKFTLRLPKEHSSLPSDVVTVAKALWDRKVKLGATMARMRVKHKATTITQLIEDSETRGRLERARSCPCAVRVKEGGGREIAALLEANDSLTQVSSPDDLKQAHTYHLARDDLVLLSPDCRPGLEGVSPVEQGELVPQDLVSYLLVDRAVCRLMKGSTAGDVVYTHHQTGAVLAHTASVVAPIGGMVRVFSVPTDRLDTIRAALREQGMNNVQLSTESFTTVAPDDELMSNVRLIVCGALPSHPHTVTHPVDLVLQEGDDNLCWLCPTPHSSTSHTDRAEDCLTHSLHFEQAEHLVLVDPSSPACSECTEDNTTFVASSEGPLTVGEEELCQTGYTLSVLNRNHPKPPPPKAVLARAVANGLLGTECLDEDLQVIIPQKQISKKRRTRQARINALHQGIPLTSTSSTDRRVGKKKTDE